MGNDGVQELSDTKSYSGHIAKWRAEVRKKSSKRHIRPLRTMYLIWWVRVDGWGFGCG